MQLRGGALSQNVEALGSIPRTANSDEEEEEEKDEEEDDGDDDDDDDR